MKPVLMVGTAFDTKGGVASVVNVYREAGLFQRADVRYVATHGDGSALRKLIRALLAWPRFLAWVLPGRVRLVHVHLSSRASFWRKCLFVWPAYWCGIPTIIHLHGSEFAVFYEDECGPRGQALVRGLFNRAAAVIVLSSAWRDWLVGVCPQARVRVVFNPVVVPPEPLRAPPGNPPGPPVVLSMGRLGKRKGSYDLLEAGRLLKDRDVPFMLRLGGDGEVEQVRARAEALGLGGQVQLLGWVGPEQRRQELAAATVYTLPSYHEGLPMSILEAMAAGLAVVSTPIGGIPDAVRHGTDGWLVPAGDVPALADALARLLSQPELARAQGEAAHARARDVFSAAALVPQVEALYAELAPERA